MTEVCARGVWVCVSVCGWRGYWSIGGVLVGDGWCEWCPVLCVCCLCCHFVLFMGIRFGSFYHYGLGEKRADLLGGPTDCTVMGMDEIC